mgnify:CR=1 FL=1
MSSAKELKNAKVNYNTMCTKLDQMGWKYERFEEDFGK